jgi:hypothetical protein
MTLWNCENVKVKAIDLFSLPTCFAFDNGYIQVPLELPANPDILPRERQKKSPRSKTGGSYK